MRRKPTSSDDRSKPVGPTTMPEVSYRFDDFVLDCDTRQLLRAGAEVHLSPKAFELLRVLLANRPRAVSKAELLECLWPSTFVEETNLAGTRGGSPAGTGRLRDAAAVSRTVYRFGYRFVGDAAESGAPALSKTSTSRPRLIFENRQAVLMDGANIIGRAPDATIQCEAPGVSRHHARILVSDGEATLEDLGSKNGHVPAAQADHFRSIVGRRCDSAWQGDADLPGRAAGPVDRNRGGGSRRSRRSHYL